MDADVELVVQIVTHFRAVNIGESRSAGAVKAVEHILRAILECNLRAAIVLVIDVVVRNQPAAARATGSIRFFLNVIKAAQHDPQTVNGTESVGEA